MTNSNKLKWLMAAGIIIALAGILDTAYLSGKYITGSPIECSILNGCDTVTSSKYSRIGGVPIAYYGLALYLISFFYLLWFRLKPEMRNLKPAMIVWGLGVVFSVFYLVGIQVFVLKAVCLYCLISSILMVLLFTASLLMHNLLKRIAVEDAQN